MTIDHRSTEEAAPGFHFKSVPPPASNDAARQARLTLVEGARDRNEGGLEVLCDGRKPSEEDEPAANFFFAAGSTGGRILMDLGSVIEVQRVSSYSWHPGARGPQVYRLFGADGQAAGFNAEPKSGTEPATCGWTLVASVDTRPKSGEPGGQYGVSVTDAGGSLGRFRYLLFDVKPTERDDPFGQTFFSEIDVVDKNGPPLETPKEEAAPIAREEVVTGGAKYRITIDTTETPDLQEWARVKVAPMAKEWYPRLVELLPSEGFEAPPRVSIVFSKDMQGVAATSGTRVRCAARWFRANLEGEALGAVFHELVHVVQQYRGGRRGDTNYSRPPGWLVEGIPDYVRWYVFEPETKGAEIRPAAIERAKYDASYRVSANFLNWVTEKHGKNLVPRLNAAMRQGKYRADLWNEITGAAVEDLGLEWKEDLKRKAAPKP